jgi:response regulator RpfG family c-di-GMP phosphodiesterase
MTEETTHHILVVDDEESIRKALERLLRRAGYRVDSAESGAAGLIAIEKAEDPYVLIISDQRMPEMNGAEFLEQSKALAPDAGRFLLTGYSDYEALVEAINRGEIHRYLDKPWNDEELLLHIGQTIEQVTLRKENREMALVIQRQNKELLTLNKDLEHKVVERSRLLLRQKEDFEETFMEAFRLLSALVEMLSPALGDYLMHVGRLSRRVAAHLEMTQTECDHIEIAGLFHDVGLVGMPDALLYSKEADMSETAFNLYAHHPVIAAVCFEAVPSYAAVSDIILNHHENMDGSGYPNQIAGEAIPIGSRILAAVSDYCRIIDLWPVEPEEVRQLAAQHLSKEQISGLSGQEGEALLSAVAEQVLTTGAGTRYDTRVVEIMIKAVAEEDVENAREKWVAVEDLLPGMTLRKAIYLESGHPLMSQGLRLNQKLIDSLQKISKHGKIRGQIYVALAS